MHPTQDALHAGLTGTGHSHLTRTKLQALGHLYLKTQLSTRCLTSLLPGYRRITASARFLTVSNTSSVISCLFCLSTRFAAA
jgi:hypothetical protein